MEPAWPKAILTRRVSPGSDSSRARPQKARGGGAGKVDRPLPADEYDKHAR